MGRPGPLSWLVQRGAPSGASRRACQAGTMRAQGRPQTHRPELVAVLHRDLVHHGGDHAAGPAPGRPEVHDDGHRAVQHLLLEVPLRHRACQRGRPQGPLKRGGPPCRALLAGWRRALLAVQAQLAGQGQRPAAQHAGGCPAHQLAPSAGPWRGGGTPSCQRAICGAGPCWAGPAGKGCQRVCRAGCSRGAADELARPAGGWTARRRTCCTGARALRCPSARPR